MSVTYTLLARDATPEQYCTVGTHRQTFTVTKVKQSPVNAQGMPAPTPALCDMFFFTIVRT